MRAGPHARTIDRRQLLHGLCLLAALPAACDRRPAATAAARRPLVELRVQSNGDLLEFAEKELSCPAAARLRVLFHNSARYVNFDHNWVLIRPGSFDAVTRAAELAGVDHGWLPSADPNIIAATPQAHKGQTVSVEFDAPPAGRYLYICSTPGHSASMWGILTVTARPQASTTPEKPT